MSTLISAVLFDLDGVLLDFVEGHFLALNKALVTCGFPEITRQDHESKFNGLPTRVKLKVLGLDPADIEKVNSVKQVVTADVIRQTISRDERLVELLGQLWSHHYKLACCSNSVSSTVEAALTALGIRDFFECALSNEDVKYPKPHPQIYLKACATLAIPPYRCVVVEDNDNGKRAALEAGCRLCSVAGPHEVTLDRIMETIRHAERAGGDLGHFMPASK